VRPARSAPRSAGFIGLIRLDTRFPRPLGDIGNRNSFEFPVRAEIVAGASAERAVRSDGRALLAPFIRAGRRLVDDGAVAIATSCGFLAPFQQELASALPVPVATSALLQIAWANALLPRSRRVGVITIDARALGERHLRAAGAPADTPIAGLPPDGVLARGIFGNLPHLDRRAAERELVETGLRLRKQHPEVATIVLECTNLPPYRAALARATGVPILDCNTLLEWLWRSVGP
jgi:Asp/Glu/hydantoin racemase